MMTPQEYLNTCTTNQKQNLIEILVEDGIVSNKTFDKKYEDNLNDEIFLESLKTLSKTRHLLSIEEENFINNLANKFKYIS